MFGVEMSKGETLSFKAGEQIFAAGDFGDCAYIVDAGLVRISVGEGEKQRVLGLLTNGQLLGEMAILDASRRMADAYALEDTQLIRINRSQFLDRINDSDPLIKSLLLLITERYRGGLAHAMGENPELNATPEPDQFTALRIEAAFKADLEQRRVDVALQPIVNIDTGNAVGFESLLRWRSEAYPDLGTQALVDIAEQTRLIDELGQYVFKKACTEFVACNLQHDHWLSVNISAKQLLEKDLVERYFLLAEEAGMPFEKILFELTESCIPSPELITGPLDRIRQLGAKVALDDYGNRSSSLVHVSQFAVDFIKLDCDLIQQLEQAEEARTITKAVIGAASALGIAIVAEGVETEGQRHILQDAGCQYVQGFLFARPASASTWQQQLEVG